MTYNILSKKLETVLVILLENYNYGKIKSLVNMSRKAIEDCDIETLQYTTKELIEWCQINVGSTRDSLNNEWDVIFAYQTDLPEIKKALESDELAQEIIKKTNTITHANTLNLILNIFNRFHLIARQLKDRHENRETLLINDEYDVQDLLHSLLKIYFDDIRPEEWTPSYAGKSSRVDFLLKKEKIVIEIKKTRDNLKTGDLAEQLIIDIAKYKTHPDCKTLLCFVYDPDEKIKNYVGLEDDLTMERDGLKVITKVCQK